MAASDLRLLVFLDVAGGKRDELRVLEPNGLGFRLRAVDLLQLAPEELRRRRGSQIRSG